MFVDQMFAEITIRRSRITRGQPVDGINKGTRQSCESQVKQAFDRQRESASKSYPKKITANLRISRSFSRIDSVQVYEHVTQQHLYNSLIPAADASPGIQNEELLF